ncbi:MAG: SDR family NAD(P)-dependent oxidoreductase [Eubacteriales bacterium]
MEYTDPKDAYAQLNVNFFGSLHCIQAVLLICAQKSGHIVNISSVAAPIAIPFQAFTARRNPQPTPLPSRSATR